MKSIRNWTTTTIARMRNRTSDRGASSIEYAGIVILVAGIILAIRALNLDTLIAGSISGWVTAMLGG